MKTSPFRSVLFVPATRPDRFAKALGSGADVVIFDLEDSVEAGKKGDARKQLALYFGGPKSETEALRLIRCNVVGSRWIKDDLDLIAHLPADGLVVPKVETPAQIDEIARSGASRTFVPILETARGVLNAMSIANAQATIPALMFGAEDLTAQMGIPRTLDGEELVFARSQVALAATTTGAVAVDAVFIDINKPDELRRDAERARALGFRGKMCIHPSQVPIVNDVFTPSAEELEKARRIVEAYDAARERGEGVIRLDDQMVDAPVAARARRLLEMAK